jgi:hypothetical protein
MSRGVSLPNDLRESSGLAESRRQPGVFWTHNDSGNGAELFAVRWDGTLLGRVQVTGARNRDWEDLAAGRCPSGGGDCLYLADTGNNARSRGGRDSISLVVVPEPALGERRTAPARRYTATFPGRRTDIEALAVLPDGSVYLVSKGIENPVELFRWPTPLDGGGSLVRVRTLAPEARETGDRVTGASASPNGRWVAVRTYAALAFYRTADLLGGGQPSSQLDLAVLEEGQGEAVSLSDRGQVVLTSEGPGKHLPGTISRLSCRLP